MARPIYVPQAGGFITFKDGTTDAEITSYLKAKYPAPVAPAPAAPATGEPSHDDSGLFSNFAYGLATGVTDIPGGIASLFYPAEQADETVGGRASGAAREFLQEKLGIDPTKERTTGQMLASGVGSLGSFLIPGLGAAKGLKALGAGARAAGLGATVTASGQGAAINAEARSEKIRSQIDSGMVVTPDEQLAAQRLDAIVGLSEGLPLGRIFGPLTTVLSKVPASKAGIVVKIISNRLAKITGAGLAEGAQEAASAIASDLVEYGVYNPDVQIGEDVLSNAGTGAFSGSLLEGIIQVAAGRKLRGARQLEEDLRTEKLQSAAGLRQARVAQGAEELRQYNVEGPVQIVEDESEGDIVYKIKTPAGNLIGSFIDQNSALSALDLYQKRTGAKITLGEPKQEKKKVKPSAIEEPMAAPKVRPALKTIPFDTSIFDPKTRKRVPSSGEGDVVDYGGRKIVIKSVNGVDVPFYLSTGLGGKKKTKSGKWYPFFGIGPNDGWINKTSAKDMADYYGSAELRAAGEELDATLGDIRSDKDIPKVGTTGQHIDFINQGLDAADNRTSETEVKVRKNIQTILNRIRKDAPPVIAKEDVVPPETVPEAVTEEAPVEEPAYEPPVEEQRFVEEETPQPREDIPTEPPKTEMRPSATMEDLAALQKELFGKPMNVREMTPEQRSIYDAARDKRFPPVETPVYYSASPGAPAKAATIKEAEALGPNLRDYTPEFSNYMKRVYTELDNRLRGIVPEDVGLELKTLIDKPGYLVRGQKREDANGLKSFIDLATGYVRPNASVEEMVKELIGTLNHEAIHALRSKGLFRPAEWRILSRAVSETKIPGKKYTYLEKAEAIYSNPQMGKDYSNPDVIIEEAVAELYKDWYNGKGAPVNTRGLLNRLTEFIRRLFRVLKSDAYKDVFKRIDSGDVKSRTPSPDGRDGTRLSASPTYDPNTSTSDWETEGAPPPGVSSVNKTGGSPYRISQRRPTGKSAGASLKNNLLVDTQAMKGNMKAYVHNVGILKSYPNMRVVDGEDPDQTLARFKEHVIENLLWLHDLMEPNLRQRAKLWYDGARKITTDLAQKYNLPDTTVAAVLAGLSPQKDWFQNVSLAERLIDIVMTKGDHPFDDRMMEIARTTPSMKSYLPLLELMEGKTFNEIKDFDIGSTLARKHNEINGGITTEADIRALADGVNESGKAIFVRFYDQAYNPREYSIVTPEGGRGALSLTGKGVPSSVAWGSFGEIGKGIDAILNGTKESVDELLGDKHKIRNFYNNIISPKSGDGSVTIDTHAVAAALLRGLAGGSDEVHHNFGTSEPKVILKTKNSDVTGVRGTYAFYADAYREAAKRRGILPREMQSITWEAVRGLYRPKFKAQAKNVAFIDAIWNNYKKGDIDADEARKQILAYADPGAGSINNPFWKSTPGPSVYGGGGPALDAGGVGRLGVRKAAERTGGRGTGGNAGSPQDGVRFSASPAVDSEEFKRWFRKSKVVNEDGTPKVQYHGTNASYRNFKQFDTLKSELGSHFGSREQASEFVKDTPPDPDEDETIVNDRIYPVYLSLQNPLRMPDANRWSTGRMARRIQKMGLISEKEASTIDAMPINHPTAIKLLQGAIEKAGYDGIVYLNRSEGIKTKVDPNDKLDMSDDDFRAKYGAEDSFIVFDPTHVKSIFNPFEEGAAESPRFSAAPLPPNIEAANDTLFAPAPKISFATMAFDYLFGSRPMAKTLNTMYGPVDISAKKMARLSTRAGVVDNTAFVAELEKLANLKRNGNYEREAADYSATAALAWRRRSSHLTASMLMRGKVTLDFARPGDIQSATMKVEEDPDSMANIIKTLMEEGPADSRTGETKDKREVFKSYAVAMRAKNKKAMGLRTPDEVDDAYINTIIPFTQANYPEVVQAYEMYQRYNRNLLTAAVQAGVIDNDSYLRLSRDMDYYGFYREVYETPLVPGMPTKTASKFALRAYTGSQDGNLVNDPIFVMVQNSQFWVDSIAKNLAAQKSFKLGKEMGVARILAASEDPDPALGEESQVMFFRENGVQKRFAVSDPLLISALGSDDRIDVGKFWKTLGLPTQILRETVTRDPGFMVANLMRDTLSAWITSGEDITPFIGTIKGMGKALKQGASFQALMGRGVVGSYDLAMLAPAELANRLRQRAMPQNVLTLNGPEAATAVIGGLWNRLGAISEASDAATRIAVYEAARAQGLSDAEATFRSIEILDFSRRGGSQVLSILTKLVPFLNARIQGLDVLYQAGKAGVKVATGNAQGEREANLGKKFLVRGAMLAAISMALEMLNDGDEDYEQLDDYIKNGNLLIPLKDFGLKGQFIAIPKPFEAGLLFSTIPQQFYKTMTGDASTRENVALFTSQLASTFGVNPIPQIILPAVEIITNHDFYTGLPLISEGKARLSPELQYNSRTSQLAMMIGKVPIWYDMTSGRFEGASPIVIDNLISGYGGPLGSYLSEAIGLAMEGTNIGPERLPRDITQLPVVRRFFMDAEVKNPKVVTQAYELFRIVDEANRSFSRLRQTGDTEAIMDYLGEHKDVLTYKTYVFKLVDRLNKMSAYERQIERDDSMTREEKVEAMKKLREMRIKVSAKVAEINAKLGR